MFKLADSLADRGVKGNGEPLFEILHALDKVTSASMWLVAHETYAQNVYLDGRPGSGGL